MQVDGECVLLLCGCIQTQFMVKGFTGIQKLYKISRETDVSIFSIHLSLRLRGDVF